MQHWESSLGADEPSGRREVWRPPALFLLRSPWLQTRSLNILTVSHWNSLHISSSSYITTMNISAHVSTSLFQIFQCIGINLHYSQYLPMSTLSVTILLSEHSSWYLPWPHFSNHTTVTYLVITDSVEICTTPTLFPFLSTKKAR